MSASHRFVSDDMSKQDENSPLQELGICVMCERVPVGHSVLLPCEHLVCPNYKYSSPECQVCGEKVTARRGLRSFFLDATVSAAGKCSICESWKGTLQEFQKHANLSSAQCSRGHAMVRVEELPPYVVQAKAAVTCRDCKTALEAPLWHCRACWEHVCDNCNGDRCAGADPITCVLCVKGHVMVPTEYREGVKCSACRSMLKPKNGFYMCETCDFVLCHEDGTAKANEAAAAERRRRAIRSVCPRGHGLTDRSTDGGTRPMRCSECNEPVDGYAMVCEACAFVRCRVCVKHNDWPDMDIAELRCPQLHLLEKRSEMPKSYTGVAAACDECGVRILLQEPFLHCDRCWYNVCRGCRKLVLGRTVSIDAVPRVYQSHIVEGMRPVLPTIDDEEDVQ